MKTRSLRDTQRTKKASRKGVSGISTLEKITCEKNNHHAWTCICGNTDRFDPCDEMGNVVEPTINGPWKGVLYVCLICKRIIDQNTLQVVGQNPKAKIIEY